MFFDDLHYHDIKSAPRSRPDGAPHWRKIPPGTWVRDGKYWARRALDAHIYDILVDMDGRIYFWQDGGDWYPEGSAHPNIEEAKALAAVLLRLKTTGS